MYVAQLMTLMASTKIFGGVTGKTGEGLAFLKAKLSPVSLIFFVDPSFDFLHHSPSIKK